MEINVSQLLKAPTGTIREYDISEDADILETGLKSLVKGNVIFTRTNRGILVQGKLFTIISIECSRCLKEFDYPLLFEIEEEFFPVIDVNLGTPVEIPEDTDSFTIDEHHILDLNEAIRQNAILAIPMKPLCRKDCAGLCYTCGKDLNQGKCECEEAPMDPRWAKLVDLVSNKTKKSRRK